MAAKIELEEFVSLGFSHHIEILSKVKDVKKVLPSEEDLRRVMDNDFEK